MLFWESLGLSDRMAGEGYGSSEEEYDDSTITSRTDDSMASGDSQSSDGPDCPESHCVLVCEQMLMDAHKDSSTIHHARLETTGSGASPAPESGTTATTNAYPITLKIPSRFYREASIIADEPLERELSIQSSSRKVISVQIPVALPSSGSKTRKQESTKIYDAEEIPILDLFTPTTTTPKSSNTTKKGKPSLTNKKQHSKKNKKKKAGSRGGARFLAEMFSGFKNNNNNNNKQPKAKGGSGGSRFSFGGKAGVPSSASTTRTLSTEKSTEEAREDCDDNEDRELPRQHRGRDAKRETVVVGLVNGYEIVAA